MKLVNVIATKDRQPVFDAPGNKGSKIGYAYLNLQLTVDVDRKAKDDLNRVFVPVRGPGDLYPWKETGKEAWIELANVKPVDEEEHEFRIIFNKDFDIIRTERLS